MSEMTLLYLLGTVSVSAVLFPLVAWAYTVYREIFSDRYVVLNERGQVIGEISANIVQRDPRELTKLRERIEQSEHVDVRAAA